MILFVGVIVCQYRFEEKSTNKFWFNFHVKKEKIKMILIKKYSNW